MRLRRVYSMLRSRGLPRPRVECTPPPEPGTLLFRCNICAEHSAALLAGLQREARTCRACGSIMRWRAIIQILSLELFGQSLALPDFPYRPDLVGLGMSDWDGYALPLAQKLSYTNTFYHQHPMLDITAIDPAQEGTCDFLISTDVFEHVPPPISLAFENARRLLKPGGVLVFSSPFRTDGVTIEHFPNLYDYEIEEIAGRYRLKNTARDGRKEIFEHLNFHEGPGTTLEMRSFARASLVDNLRRAGFEQVKIYSEPDFTHGIYWHDAGDLPLAARRRAVEG